MYQNRNKQLLLLLLLLLTVMICIIFCGQKLQNMVRTPKTDVVWSW